MWMPRIETDGYTPQNHGWTVNSGRTLLAFGSGEKTDANQNVYHSLQLTTGHYKLCFHTDGEAGKTINVRLQRLQNSKMIFSKTVEVGEDATLLFDIKNDRFGQYKLSFMRSSSSDNISVSNIVLRTAPEEDPDGVKEIKSLTPALSKGEVDWYDLSGRKINSQSTIHNSQLQRGIYIVNGKKVAIK
jgi:5-hydroxyisourate hydrolase-like protein (transthyretin family)